MRFGHVDTIELVLPILGLGEDFLAWVCVRELVTMPDEKNTGVRPQRSLKVEDTGEFPTLGLMQRLAKIEANKAEKELFSLKQRLAALKKAGAY